MKTNFYAALKLLERRAIRRAPLRARRQVQNAILAAIDAAIMDAHMSGRVYTKGGERRSPGDEHRMMLDHAKRAAGIEYERQMKECGR
jgi:hypothetical protein